MITQHFHHPDTGAVATLRMPAGWAKNCYYTLTVDQPGQPLQDVRKDFDTPAAARAGAVERQRQALADGWRMGAAGPSVEVDRSTVTMYRNGERIECDVSDSDIQGQGSVMMKNRPGRTVLTVLSEHPPVSLGERIVVRREFGSVRSQWAFVVDTFGLAVGSYSWRIAGPVVESQEADSETIDREAAIQRCIDLDDNVRFLVLWNELAAAFPDASERTQAIGRVMTLKAQRRAEAREREQAEREQRDLERRRLAERMLLSSAGVSQPAGILRPGRHNVPQTQTATDEAIKRLSGGQMPGEKHKRRINLGE